MRSAVIFEFDFIYIHNFFRVQVSQGTGYVLSMKNKPRGQKSNTSGSFENKNLVLEIEVLAFMFYDPVVLFCSVWTLAFKFQDPVVLFCIPYLSYSRTGGSVLQALVSMCSIRRLFCSVDFSFDVLGPGCSVLQALSFMFQNPGCSVLQALPSCSMPQMFIYVALALFCSVLQTLAFEFQAPVALIFWPWLSCSRPRWFCYIPSALVFILYATVLQALAFISRLWSFCSMGPSFSVQILNHSVMHTGSFFILFS